MSKTITVTIDLDPEDDPRPYLDALHEGTFKPSGMGWSLVTFYRSVDDAATALAYLARRIEAERRAECTSDDPTDHQGDTCPVHKGA